MNHLLVTNDFPPKVGGIQNMLWEIWRRLPADSFAVLTSPYAGADEFDAAQPYRIERIREKVLLPHPVMVRRIERLIAETGARHVILDPALPLGLVGPHVSVPYSVIVHGAEITVPGRLPVSRSLLARVLRGATHVFASGTYPGREAERAARRALPTVVIPPGVDTHRFTPPSTQQRAAARQRLGVRDDELLVVGVSRLVPRKGFDVAIRAVASARRRGHPVRLVIAGSGRDSGRLQRIIAAENAPATLLGRVADADLAAMYGAADVFAMLCRSRWGGLEQEGFGIVFAEAGACGVASLAGRSGGSADAVVHGETGVIVEAPGDVAAVTRALVGMLDDGVVRRAMGDNARRRVVAEFDYDMIARRVAEVMHIPM
jgi:phosphatidylinositol alpha-1,6-mannosyltransferase